MDARGMTVSDLLTACEEQVAKGNGNRHIQISRDDEGNGFHPLYYQFTDDGVEIQAVTRQGLLDTIAKAEEIVLLG